MEAHRWAQKRRFLSLSKNFARYQRARIPAMLTLWDGPSQEVLEGGPLIPGEPRIRDVVHEARVASRDGPVAT
jgi:hypothetical protein